jgi:plasmid stabilization system protein ParE
VSLQVTYHRLAELELSEAAQYYDLESPGLGASFLNEVERCTAAIAEHPEVGAFVRGSIRRRLVHRFPYGILYSHTSTEVRILVIMNLKRRPNYWVGRA